MTKTERFEMRVSPAIHALARRLAGQLGISTAEVYRRGVILLAKQERGK